MEKNMETTILAYIGFRFPRIMENQMEKKMENYMETGIRYEGYIGGCFEVLGV